MRRRRCCRCRRRRRRHRRRRRPFRLRRCRRCFGYHCRLSRHREPCHFCKLTIQRGAKISFAYCGINKNSFCFIYLSIT